MYANKYIGLLPDHAAVVQSTCKIVCGWPVLVGADQAEGCDWTTLHSAVSVAHFLHIEIKIIIIQMMMIVRPTSLMTRQTAATISEERLRGLGIRFNWFTWEGYNYMVFIFACIWCWRMSSEPFIVNTVAWNVNYALCAECSISSEATVCHRQQFGVLQGVCEWCRIERMW